MTKRRTSMEAVTADIEERGVRSAYAALVEICEDRTVSAQARAASAIAIFRAVGLQDGKKRPPLDDDPVEMSPEEMSRGMRLLQDELARLDAEIAERAAALLDEETDAEEDSTDVFE